MLVNKVTVGFVIQVFDTKLKRFVSQEFVAGDDVTCEDANGDVVDSVDDYLPFHMKQPEPPKKCVRVEYDLNYRGGDYDKVGTFAYIPLDAIDRLPGNSPGKKLKTAFTVLVGDPRHIVHYTFDEVYDQDGNEWRE
jgi:hypothetical protein